MVALILSYQNFIISRPVFIMQLKNALRNGTTTKELDKLVTQQEEAALLVEM